MSLIDACVVVRLSHQKFGWVGGTTGSTSDQQSTNDRKVVGSSPTKVVCIISQCWQVTVWGELPAMAGRHSFDSQLRS